MYASESEWLVRVRDNSSEGGDLRQGRVVVVPLLSVQDKHDGGQDLMHALTIAKLGLLLAVDEQQV